MRLTVSFVLLALGALAKALPKDANSQNTFDYIVVGSGPGGGPLAANLALAGYSVGVIEAGEDHTGDLVQQGAAFSFLPNGDLKWDFFVNYKDDPREQAEDWKTTYLTKEGTYFTGLNPPAGAKQLGVYYPRGATLGGSSSINAMCSMMPSRSDWDIIAKITGDKSWR